MTTTSTGPRAGFDTSFDPRTGLARGEIPHTSAAEVDEVVSRAAAAAGDLAASDPERRLEWLYAVAAALIEHLDELAALGDRETALGPERLRGEIIKASESAKFYARTALEGSYLALSTETLPDGARLSRWNVPVGPVAVFGASNFPFGFGAFGHDVASALSAGCPVVVKAHPAHPQLSQLLRRVVEDALRVAGAPAGVYGMVVGFDAGLQLVDDPRIRAVAFTGSQAGGMALVERGARRGVPVFAEMGTVNPVFVTRRAARDRDRIAQGFVSSFTLGAGQFCTKPGLLLAPSGHGFPAAIEAEASRVAPAPLLTAQIAAHFASGFERLAAAAADDAARADVPASRGGDATPVAEDTGSAYAAAAHVVRVRLEDLVPGSPLLEECFGPVALVAEYEDPSAAFAALARLSPSLAASVFTADGEADADEDAPQAIRSLLSRTGRVAVNAWPTGVATAWSQQHGGPWPATSRPDATSVGGAALSRFVRPVSLQNADPARFAAPFAATDPAPPRRVDGVLVTGAELRDPL
jgi:NADP-dependent aldehyde dehydrogenase